jgi:DNA-binding XRE family transcriptional regulator
MSPVRETYHGVKIEEFLAQTNILEKKECTNWEGPVDRHGRPFTLACTDADPTLNRPRSAVRMCAGFFGVKIDAGRRIRMVCGNPLCINPAHIGCSKTVKKRNPAHGERNGNAKLTDVQVIVIRMRAQAGDKQADLAREFGVTPSYISDIVKEKVRKPQKRIRLNIW